MRLMSILQKVCTTSCPWAIFGLPVLAEILLICILQGMIHSSANTQWTGSVTVRAVKRKGRELMQETVQSLIT